MPPATLRSFPTRRSSDLDHDVRLAGHDLHGGEVEGLQSRGAHPVHARSEEHTSELQSRGQLVCRLLPDKKNRKDREHHPLLALRDPDFLATETFLLPWHL